MKKLIIFAALSALLACCSTYEDATPEPFTGTTVEVMVNLKGIDFVSTRGFVDDMAQEFEWEKRIDNLQIFVFDNNGNFMIKKELKADELQEGKTLISVPSVNNARTYTFYAVANDNNSSFDTSTETNFLTTQHRLVIGNYNQQSIDVMLSGEYFKSRPAPMSGSTKAVISPDGTVTQVDVMLKRLLSKVAFELSIDPDFTSNHGGATIDITRIRLLNAQNYTYLFERENGQFFKAEVTSQSQNLYCVDGQYRSLWYLYEANNRSNPTRISIETVFDGDGDTSTTQDRQNLTFTVPVDYITGNGLIQRNTVYRISGIIKRAGITNEISWHTESWNVEDGHEQVWQ